MSLIVETTAFLTLVSHVAIVIFFIGLWLKIPAAVIVKNFLARRALELSFLFALAGLVGSLLYSEVLGFSPCVLCWWGRVLLYPQVLLFATAIYFKEHLILKYAAVLSAVGAVVTLYHSYIQLSGRSFIPCTAEGASCAVVYALNYDYITIPAMAFTNFLILLILYWLSRGSVSRYV